MLKDFKLVGGLWCFFFNAINSHAAQFGESFGFSKDSHIGFQLVWVVCCWIIWKEINNCLFNNVELSIKQLVE
jgi:hypothetical protein